MPEKPCFRGPLDRQHWKWVESPIAIRMAAPLQYLLNTVKVVALEKVSLSYTQNTKTVC